MLSPDRSWAYFTGVLRLGLFLGAHPTLRLSARHSERVNKSSAVIKRSIPELTFELTFEGPRAAFPKYMKMKLMLILMCRPAVCGRSASLCPADANATAINISEAVF
jgi:hypothetical protein